MKKCMLFFVMLLAMSAIAQSTHSVVLTWVDGKNPTGTTYNVYRAPGLCSGSPVFAKISSGVGGLTFTDSGIAPGSYCYQVTAVSSAIESSPSNSVNPVVGPFSPTGLSVVVN